MAWGLLMKMRTIWRTVPMILAVLPLLATPSRADEDLYRAVGEKPGLVVLIDRASGIWLQDDRIKGQFDNINMDRLRGRLVDQFCVLLGGPCTYTGRDMVAAHKGLHLRNVEFNALAEDLQTAMEQLDVPFGIQMKVIGMLAPMQRQIVTQ